jgi:hypothetical protein
MGWRGEAGVALGDSSGKKAGGSIAARVSPMRDVTQRPWPELCEPEALEWLAPPPEECPPPELEGAE